MLDEEELEEQECSQVDSEMEGRAGIINKEKYWPNGMVFYKIDPKFRKYFFKNFLSVPNMNQQHSAASSQVSNIQQAMDDIECATCIKFKERSNEEDYVYFRYGGGGCSSEVGMVGGRQEIQLSPGSHDHKDCAEHLTIVTHEIIHALGFHHEMVRPDRDNYVTVKFDNVQDGRFSRCSKDCVLKSKLLTGQRHNFKIAPNQTTFGIKFNYLSIMMYRWNEFAKDRSKPTIVAKQPGVGRNMRGDKMSDDDILAIRTMYKCDRK